MKKCGITGCPNNIVEAPDKQYFYAPRDKGIRGLWIYTTGKNYQEKSNFVVCQDHFNMLEDIDYTRTDGRPAVKRGIIPHLHLEGTGRSSAGRSSTTVDVFSDDQADLLSARGVKRKIVDSSVTDSIDNVNQGPQPNLHLSTAETSTRPNVLSSSSETSKSRFELLSSTPASAETSNISSLYIPESDDVESELEDEDESELEDEFDTGSEDESEECIEETNQEKYEKKLMRELTIKVMKKKIQHYTGIPPASAYIVDLIVERKLMSELNLFLVLRKIRHDETFEILGDLFGITRQRAGQIFKKNVEILAFHLKSFVYWPSLIDVKLNLPLQFKHKYKKVESIIDCFESEIKQPHHPVDQALTWSNYKHCNTLKHLISGTPDGMINYMSKGFTGRITDNEIVKRSGYLLNIKKDTEAMADRGFKESKSEIESKGGLLHKPPSTQAGLRFTKEEAKLCKSVAATRIHIERVIGKIRDFALLKPHRASVNSKRAFLIEYSLTVAAAICNMQGHLTKI